MLGLIILDQIYPVVGSQVNAQQFKWGMPLSFTMGKRFHVMFQRQQPQVFLTHVLFDILDRSQFVIYAFDEATGPFGGVENLLYLFHEAVKCRQMVT